MKKIWGLLNAAHLGPTVLVTVVSFLLAAKVSWEGPAYVIAAGVFFGQLIVGWSNDLHDFEDDKRHDRQTKPLVAGSITRGQLQKCLWIVIPLAVVVNLLGPLGMRGGSVYMFGVGCGVAYNFYFKYTIFSPLPYALAFAALPACVVISDHRSPALWLLSAGALLGMAAHFANGLKDLGEDRISGFKGLPARIGDMPSRAACAVLLAGATLVLHLEHANYPILAVGCIGAILTFFAPRGILFKILMLAALADVFLLVQAI